MIFAIVEMLLGWIREGETLNKMFNLHQNEISTSLNTITCQLTLILLNLRPNFRRRNCEELMCATNGRKDNKT